MWTAKSGGLLIVSQPTSIFLFFFRDTKFFIHGLKISLLQEKSTTLACPHPYFSGKNDQNEPFLSTDGSPTPLPVRLNRGLNKWDRSGRRGLASEVASRTEMN